MWLSIQMGFWIFLADSPFGVPLFRRLGNLAAPTFKPPYLLLTAAFNYRAGASVSGGRLLGGGEEAANNPRKTP